MKEKTLNGFLLLIPFLLIRFLLLSILNKEAVGRAAYFAPMQGRERTAYWIYQISNVGIFAGLFFLNVPIDFSMPFYLGIFLYSLGLFLCAAAMVSFSSPDRSGFSKNGIYRFSRNPMYLAYFICFLGMCFLTRSLILLGIVLIFQFSGHWIILAEERWCIEKFGEEYIEYMKQVRRYI